MLLKGCKKNLVVVKGFGSDYIEEAYLILRSELPAGTVRGDIVKEANRIIQEYDSGKKKRKRTFSFPSFLMGMCIATAGALFLVLIF